MLKLLLGYVKKKSMKEAIRQHMFDFKNYMIQNDFKIE